VAGLCVGRRGRDTGEAAVEPWRCAAPTPRTWGYARVCGLHGASSGQGRGAVWGAGQGLVVCGEGVAGLCVGRRGRDTGEAVVVPWRCAAPTPHAWGYACVCGLHGASSGQGRGAVLCAGQGVLWCLYGAVVLCAVVLLAPYPCIFLSVKCGHVHAEMQNMLQMPSSSFF
jgi:hypothetical protein